MKATTIVDEAALNHGIFKHQGGSQRPTSYLSSLLVSYSSNLIALYFNKFGGGVSVNPVRRWILSRIAPIIRIN
jgi:hypothetical protein